VTLGITIQFLKLIFYFEVPLSSLRKIPENIASLATQCLKCKLAYVKVPSMNHQIGRKVIYKIYNGRSLSS
jgi:hypothetical protein